MLGLYKIYPTASDMMLPFMETTYSKPSITDCNCVHILQNTPSTWISIAVCAVKIVHQFVVITSFTASARVQVTALKLLSFGISQAGEPSKKQDYAHRWRNGQVPVHHSEAARSEIGLWAKYGGLVCILIVSTDRLE